MTGLEYLHEHNIVHGDLKGVGSRSYCAIGWNADRRCKVNILVDSQCRTHLADFGLATIVNESTSRTTATVSKKHGTIRWMAPELLYPDMFEFTGRFENQLPSKDTDIYAIGMTILEVSAYSFPSKTQISPSGRL